MGEECKNDYYDRDAGARRKLLQADASLFVLCKPKALLFLPSQSVVQVNLPVSTVFSADLY